MTITFRKHPKNLDLSRIGRSAESIVEELVLYEALYENPNGKFWVRPKEMFLEDVVIDGKIVPRFEPIRE